MPRKRPRPPITAVERLLRLRQAGLPEKRAIPLSEFDRVNQDLPDRVELILQILEKARKKPRTDMLCFIMYDIQHHRIRTQIAKFLLRKGCYRVQKSVYLAQLNRKTYQEIARTLREIQELYDNHDSIFLVPVSEDEVRGMKVIGQNLELDLLLDRKNTLFF